MDQGSSRRLRTLPSRGGKPLSLDEFLSWQRLMEAHGVRGLRATKVQSYRGGPAPLAPEASEP